MKITFAIYSYRLLYTLIQYTLYTSHNRFENRYASRRTYEKNYKHTQLYTLIPIAQVATLPAWGNFTTHSPICILFLDAYALTVRQLSVIYFIIMLNEQWLIIFERIKYMRYNEDKFTNILFNLELFILRSLPSVESLFGRNCGAFGFSVFASCTAEILSHFNSSGYKNWTDDSISSWIGPCYQIWQ